MKLRKRLLVSVGVVILLAGAAIWYSRPVTLPDLMKGRDLQEINALIWTLGDLSQEPETATVSVSLSSPEGAALLGQLQQLSFRRSLPDRLLKPLAEAVNASSGSVSSEAGDWMFTLSLTSADGDFASLNFTVREWNYAAPGRPDFYGCSVQNGDTVGRSLAEQLWALAAQSNSIS